MELAEIVLVWRPEDMNATNKKRQTALHLAVIHVHTDLVLGLCRNPQGWRLRAAEVDKTGATPLDYAFEQGKKMREIQNVLLCRDDVKEHVERIYRLDMNTMNAIFIGSTLFASVTYIAWMQPTAGLVENYDFPLPSPPAPSDTYELYANTRNRNVKLFFTFNTIAFIFSLVSIYHGVEALASNQRLLEKGYVSRHLRASIRLCHWYFVLATTFIIVAFEQAGYAVLAPGKLWYIHVVMHVLWVTGVVLATIYARKVIKRELNRFWRATESKVHRIWSKKPLTDSSTR